MGDRATTKIYRLVVVALAVPNSWSIEITGMKKLGESVDEFTWIGVTMSGRTINNLRYADDIVS